LQRCTGQFGGIALTLTGDPAMGITAKINVMMLCAAFGFVGAVLMGIF
jgi:hypothetical protein